MSTEQPLDVDTDLRLLIVMRHGEAQTDSDSGDEGRELTDRGREHAQEAGRWLTAQGLRPDVAIVSAATRTRQTWEALEAGGVEAGEVRVDKGIYNCEVPDLVEVITALPAAVRVAVLVAHSPAVPELTADLQARCDLPEGWAPATLGVVSHPGEWDEFPSQETALVTCHGPVVG